MGSTGTGKSDVSELIPSCFCSVRLADSCAQLAVELAVRFNGEIINADAVQMYKGLPVITNKISLEEQRSIPHHLLGNIDLNEETWVVGVFKTEANKVIQEIRSRGRLPIVVGGTGYYTSKLLFKDSLVGKSDKRDDAVPAQDSSVAHPILEDTTEAMWKKLKEVDPVMADRWHPNDRRKIRRSLEIFLTTGKRASDIYDEQQRNKTPQAPSDANNSKPESLLFWVHSESEVLKERLNKRVDKMLDNGLMEEITQMDHHLRSAGEATDFTKGIWQSIGFKEFQPYLKALRDEASAKDAEKAKQQSLEDMKTATRQYAKYQVKWITKKIVPQLKEQQVMDQLYVLDSTDVTRYSDNVTDKAVLLTRHYLAGEEMPEPASISEAAKTVLDTAIEKGSQLQGTPCRKTCTVCNVTTLTEELWEQHVKGKTHRRLLRHSHRTAMTPFKPAEKGLMVVAETSPPMAVSDPPQ